MKKLSELALNISEPEYRARPELSYSMLSTFQSVGYDKEKLFEKKASPSLRFGSQVDTLLTGSQEEYDSMFFVSDLPKLKDEHIDRIRLLYSSCGSQYRYITDIPNDTLDTFLRMTGFWADPKYKPETRIKKFLENPVEEWYQAMFLAEGKTMVTQEEYNRVCLCVEALRDRESTGIYFKESKGNMESFSQLKFAGVLNGIGYRVMFDRIIVLHDKKIVVPIDLKTSLTCAEKDFYSNFIKWHYQLQARLYTRILRQIMDNDDYYKDFKLLNFRFIFCNPDTLDPLVWEFEDSDKKGTLVYGRNHTIVMPDPEDLGKDLQNYLQTGLVPEIPKTSERNGLVKFLNCL